jgi:peptidoglycan/xylan/chitin deacetylase (PgdA/CDA1 family)
MARLDRALTISLARWQQLSRATPRAGIPILMYHSVSENLDLQPSPYYRLTTSPRRFRGQMQWLSDNGYRTIGIPDALAALGKPPSHASARLVVLTFDDGFRDFLTDAWPVLHSCGFTATVFLPTAFIGPDRKQFKGRDCLTWDEARELVRGGVSFGSHTVSHRKLRGLPWPEISRELRASRQDIEDALGTAVTLFAHPYAFPREDPRFVADLRSELVESGYEIGVTTLIGRLRKGDDPLCVKRLPVNDHDDKELLRCKLSGAYDWIGRAQAVSRVSRRVLETVGNRGSSLRTTPRRPSDSGVD